MDLELAIVEGEEEGRVYLVREGLTSRLGRSPECEVYLVEQGVSRAHCEIDNDERRAMIRDLGSANGTYVNGERVEEKVLSPGDEIMLGPTVLECRASLVPLPGPAALGEARLSFREEAELDVVRKVVEIDPKSGDISAAADAGRAQRNLATAYQVSRLLVGAVDSSTVFQEIIDAIFQNTAAERAALLLREFSEDGREAVRIVASRSRDAKEGPQEFVVSRSVVRDVLQNGVSLLSWDAATDERYRQQDSVLQQRIRSVVCAPVSTDDRVLGVLYADTVSRPGAFSDSDLELLALIGNQAGLAIQRAELQTELERSFLDTIRAIVATIDAKDGYTHHHSERVGELAVRIAGELGRPEDDLQVVRLSALVHDVGKVGVPEAILNKPGRLTDDEFAEMREHPLHGVGILSHIQSPLLVAILPGVRNHHERWDGSGYPDGLAGEEIPFLGRIIAVADVLDALSSGRPYREGMSFGETVEFVSQNSGSHFDPAVVAAAVALHERGELDAPRATLDPAD